MKRRRKKLMVIIPVAVVCVAGAGTVGYFKVAHTKPVQNVTVQAQSAEAKKGNLSKTIVGTGNLELAEAEDQDAPSGLEISEVMVESGDEVKEGDVLAVVDESSILEAMEQVQEEISQLDESIQEYQDSDEENVIESSVSGRVKKINVSAGSDVSDTMVSDGAFSGRKNGSFSQRSIRGICRRFCNSNIVFRYTGDWNCGFCQRKRLRGYSYR